jgi:hypothetical protein
MLELAGGLKQNAPDVLEPLYLKPARFETGAK